MRIIGGIHRGRKFNPPSFYKARPTTDFAKESLFNILTNRIDLEGKEVLDLFSGTGSISYEFISRECGRVCAVDSNPRYLAFIKKTAEELHPESKIIQTIKADVFIFLKKAVLDYDLIFADPPYDLLHLEKIPDLIFANKSLRKNAIVVVEHSASANFTKHAHFEEHRKYGSVNFSFFR
jgi:16S rRNA (guanine966-N2)-methyltransferase